MPTLLLPKNLIFVFILLMTLFSSAVSMSSQTSESQELDEKVKNFLDQNRYQWRDANVPFADGQLLFDIIINNKYTQALEIGTSTGHSAIWIAWALSKTGGKLITIEIDERRYHQALSNFKEAGLSEYIDARLADAHELVLELEGPFDFVFSDADKGWYKNYFIAIEPKLKVGGCFTAHNIGGRGMWGTGEFLKYIESLSHMETTVDKRGAGVSISFKKAEK